ncbi:hypothetical protein SAMN06297164_1915 [Nitrosomonas ureae]|uniref:Uncharacterized protein n=1 Tax=Nitrosomonas ureae TaxID=44577 RepID=A0A286AAI6_9PROT|nr:hypothetical protein SAMN06297164_1915 [Nitrosomonas ureae]
MRLDILLPLFVTTLVAIAGWYIVHRMASNRDRINKKRDLRVKYLIEAYQAIESACSRGENAPYRERLERAVGDVQLFGNSEQVQLAKKFSTDMESTTFGDPRSLLVALRDDLRRELNLEPVKGEIWHFRITGEVSPQTQGQFEKQENHR